VWTSHLLVMGTGEMSGGGGGVSRQVGRPFSHDHSMTRLMNTHVHVDTHTHAHTHAHTHG